MNHEQHHDHRNRLEAQTASAIFLLVAGVALAAASLFIPPKGEIAGSVCWIFAQCLIYAGSVFGIKEYVRACAREHIYKGK